MLHIEIEPVWRFRKEGSPQAAIVMLGILNQIRQTGKLTSAATHANLSYRHVWNLIEQWSALHPDLIVAATHRRHGIEAIFRRSHVADLLEIMPFDLLVTNLEVDEARAGRKPILDHQDRQGSAFHPPLP